jgi:hypothetical protein
MAVPAHDQRDYEFAKNHNLEIIKVIASLEEFEEYSKTDDEDILSKIEDELPENKAFTEY